MRKIALLSGGLGAMFACVGPTMPAHADFWVASNGSGTACTRASPCNSFQAAHNAAFDGAVIRCLDSFESVEGAGNGNLIINRSITIDCTATNSSIWSGNLPAISFSTGGNVVTLRGLSIDGLGGSGQFGIDLTGNNELHVENCRIANWQGASNTIPTAAGIRVAPAASSTGKLYVSDSVIQNNGKPSTGGGIIIQPSGSGSARVVLNRVQVESNFHGILVDGTGSTGVILAEVRDSVVAGNRGHGIAAISNAGASPTGIVVDRTSSMLNAASGILAQGAAVHLGNSTVTGNTTGLNVAGGQILSYQNNQTSGNFNDGAPTGVLTLR
jgi:hypothetical protein